MNVLAIDTSGPVCGVAVLRDGTVAAEMTACNKLTHSVNLMPMTEAALSAAGIALHEVDRLAVVTGPGSFTGVRIGVSTAKGMAHGANLACVAVDALEAMAAGVGSFDGIVCPLQDARAGQVYGAAFRVTNGITERLMDDIPLKLEDFVLEVQKLGERFLFLGDGMPVHRQKLECLLGKNAVFAAPHMAFLRPAAVAWLGAQAEETTDYLSLMPMYLRAPSAERNKKLMEAMRDGR